MRYRRLGDSGLRVSAVSFGTWLTAGNTIDREGTDALVRTALDCGINLLDTADVYARGAAEDVLGLVIAGAVTLGVSWSLSALAAASYSGTSSYTYYDGTTGSYSDGSFGDASALWPLYIPVLGPWIEMGFLHGSGAPLGGALLAFDGLVQAGGLAMLIAGAVTRTRVAIYAKNNLQISPLTLTGGSGILVGGRF